MPTPMRREAYRRSWSRVEDEYLRGLCVSERNLQALLYRELKQRLPQVDIVVEPTWYYDNDRQWSPDLVIVESKEITDIFELKFVPHDYPKWEYDIEKLLGYIQDTDSKMYPVSLEPGTGKFKWSGDQWHKYATTFRPRRDCDLHFVAVGQHDAAAVDPVTITTQVQEAQGAVNFWYGRVGNGNSEWNIQFAT